MLELKHVNMLEINSRYQNKEGDVANHKWGGLPRSQTVVSKHLFPLKGLLREMANSRTRAGKVQDEPGSRLAPESKEIGRGTSDRGRREDTGLPLAKPGTT